MVDQLEAIRSGTDVEHASTRVVVRELTAFGLGAVVAPVSERLTKMSALDASLIALRAGGDAALARVTARIAGRGEVAEADLAELGRFASTSTRSYVQAPVGKAVDAARAVLAREAHASAMAVAPQVFSALAKRADEAVAVCAKVKLPETVIDEATFLAANLDGKLWDRIAPAARYFYEAHKLYGLLRRSGWLPRCPEGVGSWTMWSAPHKRVLRYDQDPSNAAWKLLTYEDLAGVVDYGRNLAMPDPIRLVHSITKGAGPRMVDPVAAQRDHKTWLAARALAERRKP